MISCIGARKRARGDLKALLNTPAWEHIKTCQSYECSQLWRKLNRAVDLNKDLAKENGVNLMVDGEGRLPFAY